MNTHLHVLLSLSVLLWSSATHALTTNTRYDYDVAAGTSTVTNANGEATRYRYDAAGNLKEVKLLGLLGQPAYNFNYDLTDQLTDMTYPGGRASGIDQGFDYDTFDRVTSVRDYGNNGTLLQTQFDYDHRDRITWITYPDSTKVCYEYDADGRITAVGRGGSSVSALSPCSQSGVSRYVYRYDGGGRLTGIDLPNGLSQFIEYDGTTGLIHRSGYRRGSVTVAADTFDYYPKTALIQQITREDDSVTTHTRYSYDGYQRLVWTQDVESGLRVEYDYDNFGNRSKECGAYLYQYPPSSSRLADVYRDGVQQAHFVYDNAGQLKSRIDYVNGVAKTTNYEWDGRGNVTRVVKPDGTDTRLAYDGLGTRKSKSVTRSGVTTTTYYVTATLFGLPQVLMEYSGTNKQRSYVYGGTQVLHEEDAAGTRRYNLIAGAVGNIAQQADNAGNILARYDYDSFGAAYGATPATYGYTGQRYDNETGLLYLRARYYDRITTMGAAA